MGENGYKKALIPRYADNVKKINNTRFEILNATFASDLILDKKIIGQR